MNFSENKTYILSFCIASKHILIYECLDICISDTTLQNVVLFLSLF